MGSIHREWLDEWDHVLRAGDLAEHSRIVYTRGATQFVDWLETTHPDLYDPAQVTARHALGWAEHLKTERRLAKATRSSRLIAATLWFKYMAAQEDSAVDINPFRTVERPKPDEAPPETISDDELRALLKTCGSDFIGRRDEAIIRLLLDTGIREGELAGINVDDVNLGHMEVRVTGKTGTRIVPFGNRTAVALRKYMRVRASRPYAESPSLFQPSQLSRTGAFRLSPKSVWSIIDRRCRYAGIPHRWPHQLRHTWADDMLSNGANEGDVERLGGWTSGSKMVKWYGSAGADRRARDRARTLSRGDRV